MSTIKRKQVTKEAINKWRQNHGKWPLEARVTKEELDLGETINIYDTRNQEVIEISLEEYIN